MSGRYVAAEAKRVGYVVKVIGRKGLEDSQLVYRNDLQAAVLPKTKREQFTEMWD